MAEKVVSFKISEQVDRHLRILAAERDQNRSDWCEKLFWRESQNLSAHARGIKMANSDFRITARVTVTDPTERARRLARAFQALEKGTAEPGQPGGRPDPAAGATDSKESEAKRV